MKIERAPPHYYYIIIIIIRTTYTQEFLVSRNVIQALAALYLKRAAFRTIRGRLDNMSEHEFYKTVKRPVGITVVRLIKSLTLNKIYAHNKTHDTAEDFNQGLLA